MEENNYLQNAMSVYDAVLPENNNIKAWHSICLFKAVANN